MNIHTQTTDSILYFRIFPQKDSSRRCQHSADLSMSHFSSSKSSKRQATSDKRQATSSSLLASSSLNHSSRHPSNIILHRPSNLVPGTVVVFLILDANHQHSHTVVITHTHHTYARTHTTDLHTCIPTSIL